MVSLSIALFNAFFYILNFFSGRLWIFESGGRISEKPDVHTSLKESDLATRKKKLTANQTRSDPLDPIHLVSQTKS